MASQIYVGKVPTTPEGVVTRLSAQTQMADGPSRVYVDGQVVEAASSLATKAFVDDADSGFVEPSYASTRDALNIPITARGAANGVASLGSDSKIPAEQIPGLGAGLLRGPWGPTNTASGTTGATPLKIGEFVIGPTTWNFRPLVFLTCQVETILYGRPVIEVRIGDADDTAYADQTLVATGTGRSNFNDQHTVEIFPGGPLGAMSDGVQTYYGPNFDTRLTVWAYSAGRPEGQITIGTGSLWTAAAFIARVPTP